MINFKKVTVSNFKGFGKKPTSLNLERDAMTLILGNNEDIGEQGTSKNGVGKTTILEAVVFALYGKGMGKAKPDEMVNLKNGKKMLVTLDFEVNGKKCQIKRGRKPNVLELEIDGQSLTRDSMKNTDAEIVDTVGVTYNSFISIFFLNPFKESFMSMSSVGQKNHIEELLSLDTLAKRAATLKEMKKDLAVDIKLKNKDVDNAINMNDHIQKNIDALEQHIAKFEEMRQEDIEEYSDAIEKGSQIDFEHVLTLAHEIHELDRRGYCMPAPSVEDIDQDIEEEVKNLQELKKWKERSDNWQAEKEKKQDALKKELEQMPSRDLILERDRTSIQLEELTSDLLKAETGLNNLQRTLDEIDEKEEKLTQEFHTLDSGKCPYCSQRHTDEERLDEIAADILDLQGQREKLQVTIKEYNDKIEVIQEEQKKLRENFPDVSDSITLDDRDNLEMKLIELEESTNNEAQEVLNDLESKYGTESEIQSNITRLNSEYNKTLEELAVVQKAIDEDNEKLENLKKECMDTVGTYDIGEIKLLQREVEAMTADIEKIKTKPNPYKEQLASADRPKDIEPLKQELADMEEKERHIGYLIKLLTDPKSFIRKNIVDQFLPYLNKQIYNYTTMLGLPHVAEIQNDMTVEIEYMSKTVSYSTLSRGEMLRLDAATAMAFRDLVGMMGVSTNLMLVDEYVDSSLDAYGVSQVMSLLASKCPNLFLISHKEQFADSIENKIVVTKRNGFSFLE